MTRIVKSFERSWVLTQVNYFLDVYFPIVKCIIKTRSYQMWSTLWICFTQKISIEKNWTFNFFGICVKRSLANDTFFFFTLYCILKLLRPTDNRKDEQIMHGSTSACNYEKITWSHKYSATIVIHLSLFIPSAKSISWFV